MLLSTDILKLFLNTCTKQLLSFTSVSYFFVFHERTGPITHLTNYQTYTSLTHFDNTMLMVIHIILIQRFFARTLQSGFYSGSVSVMRLSVHAGWACLGRNLIIGRHISILLVTNVNLEETECRALESFHTLKGVVNVEVKCQTW